MGDLAGNTGLIVDPKALYTGNCYYRAVTIYDVLALTSSAFPKISSITLNTNVAISWVIVALETQLCI